jgi:hypothetical protein
MHRTIAISLLLISLSLGAMTAVRAQSLADLDHLPRALDLRLRALNIARRNLEQLTPTNPERAVVAGVIDADVAVFAEGVKVFTVAYIARGLKNPEDFRFAQTQFRSTVKAFISTADEKLQVLDSGLGNIATPDALGQARTIRDAVADLRDFLKPFAAEG